MIFAFSLLLILNQIITVILFENFPLILSEFLCSEPALHHCLWFPLWKNFLVHFHLVMLCFIGFCTTNEGSLMMLFPLSMATCLESEAIIVFCFSPLTTATKEWETFTLDYGYLCIPSKILIGFLGVIKLWSSKSNPLNLRITFPSGMITNLLWPLTLSSITII